jgi:hypothetical protein
MIHPDLLAAPARGGPDRRLSGTVRGGNKWTIIATHSSPAG